MTLAMPQDAIVLFHLPPRTSRGFLPWLHRRTLKEGERASMNQSSLIFVDLKHSLKQSGSSRISKYRTFAFRSRMQRVITVSGFVGGLSLVQHKAHPLVHPVIFFPRWQLSSPKGPNVIVIVATKPSFERKLGRLDSFRLRSIIIRASLVVGIIFNQMIAVALASINVILVMENVLMLHAIDSQWGR